MTERNIRIECATAIMELTMGYETRLDVSNLHLIGDVSWTAKVIKRKDGSILNVYAVGRVPGGFALLHRLITDAPKDLFVDHIDSDGLNNMRSNLRLATRAQNTYNKKMRIDNKSGVKGVCWSSQARKWIAQIAFEGRVRYLGSFADIADAAEAYARESRALHGQFGRLG